MMMMMSNENGHGTLKSDAIRFIETLLQQAPTRARLEYARSIVANFSSELHLVTKTLLNDWIELAQIQLSKAGGQRGTALGDLVASMNAAPTVHTNVQVCLSNGEWRKIMLFSSTQHRVTSLGTLKECAFGKLKRGALVEPDPLTIGKFNVSSQFVAVKMSKHDLAHQGIRITGERIFESSASELALLQLLGRFNHPYIMSLLASGRDDRYLYCVFPLARMNLRERLETEKIPNVLELIHKVRLQIGSALDFMHSQGFAHRDVSLENILEMEDGSLRLIDFGLAVSLTLADLDSGEWMPIPLDQRDNRVYAVGKTRYLAPEFFRRGVDMKTMRYDPCKTDVFALGVCLFHLLYRAFPYHYSYPDAALEPSIQQLSAFWNDHAHNFYANFQMDIRWSWIWAMIERDVSKRLTARQCVQVIHV